MKIGIDFDNTIACYDGLFHALALEQGLIPADLPTDKTAVRDYLRSINREDNWTALQGVGYGPAIVRASPYPGVCEFIQWCADMGIETFIVSHKTRTPYIGEPYDLHEWARRFLDHHRISPAIIPAGRVFFELTKQAKLERIATLDCTHFIDDLPEFLAEPAFPKQAKRILFDPADRYASLTTFNRICRWHDLTGFFQPQMDADGRGSSQ